MSPDFHSQKVVITGAAGFLGSHLVDACLSAGAEEVIGIDNFLTGHHSNLQHLVNEARFKFIEADASSDPASYLPASYQPDCVFHFASPASPPRYQLFPIETYQVNAFGTHNWLQYLRDHSPEARFVFASTSEVYGDPLVHPQPESYWGNVNPNGIRSCYDEAKRMGETISGVFHRDFGMDTRLIRIFNTYGPRMDPDDGRVIPNFITQALDDKPLTIYGSGEQTRSYCFVSDLVAGIIKVAATPDLAGETFNVGNPDELTVKETAKAIIETIKQRPAEDSDFEFLPLPKDDPTRRKPDISKVSSQVGWQPQVPLLNGLEETIAYFRSLR